VIDESVLLELQRATHVTLQLLAAELADLELTASEINALGNLAHGDGLTVSTLGIAVGTRPATLTGILDRLEGRGLITRGPQPGDRRAVLIRLTAEGRRTGVRIRRTIGELEQRALADLPAAAIDGARRVLQALTAARP
jgi:DNA-binding MarR family transcriptional regulator